MTDDQKQQGRVKDGLEIAKLFLELTETERAAVLSFAKELLSKRDKP